MVSLFLVSSPQNFHPIPPHLCVYEGAPPPPTHPLLPHPSSIPLHWGNKPPQDQVPLLPLMADEAVLSFNFSIEFPTVLNRKV